MSLPINRPAALFDVLPSPPFLRLKQWKPGQGERQNIRQNLSDFLHFGVEHRRLKSALDVRHAHPRSSWIANLLSGGVLLCNAIDFSKPQTSYRTMSFTEIPDSKSENLKGGTPLFQTTSGGLGAPAQARWVTFVKESFGKNNHPDPSTYIEPQYFDKPNPREMFIP